jgi:L-threonylcarbamoyladenylate synthase
MSPSDAPWSFADNAEIARAVEVLRRGGLVAFPTETVYGLGADAENQAAVRRIFEVKGRPAGHPLIVHLGRGAKLVDWAAGPTPLAQALAARFWPGPLTLVVRKPPRLPAVVTGGLPTVGLRMPRHPVTQALLAAFDGAVAAPSANRFGAVSPTTAVHVREDLGADVDLVLEGGPCEIGLESTIVDVSGDSPAILRPGTITREALEAVAGQPMPLRAGGPVRAPGQLVSHYAPRAEVVLVPEGAIAETARRLLAQGRRVGVLVTEPLADDGLTAAGLREVVVSGSRADLARQLYAALRELDHSCDAIITSLPQDEGLGTAIADRLRRAAGPRIGQER